jgi:phosphatidylinositol alpha-1,6-mannosyltransferase
MARRRVCRESAAVLAISNAMRLHLITNDHVDAGKVFAFPMGVLNAPPPSADEVESLRQRLQLPRGRTVVFSGVLDPVREPGFMLDVFDLVRVKLSDAVFLVLTYQTDERRRQFEAEALRRGADVRVIGPVPFRDVATYLRCADVAISPYRPMLEHKVASPTKSIEAMNAGLPVVGSCEVDEHADVLESSGGGVSVPWDRRQFANAIEALLQDPQRRHRMGEHGRAWTLEHRTYAHLTEYLERIVAASSHPAARRALPHEP